MADAELQKRLDEVSKMLGQKVTLVESPADAQDEAETSELPDPLQWQRDMVPDPEEDEEPKDMPEHEEPEQEEFDAPKRFFDHDAGPRANIQDAFDNFRFIIGEPIESSAEFCPWTAVTAYPYTFVGKTNRPHVEPLFDNIFENRVWDFFYLFHPTHPRERPYLFVPTSQLQAFLDSVNKTLGISLCIPAGPPSEQFFIQFGQGSTPRPRYLKRLADGKFFEEHEWPDIDIQDTDDFRAASTMCQEDLLAKLKLVSTPASKDKAWKQKKSMQKRVDREYMLKEAQTLLGLENTRPLHGIKGGDNVVFIAMDVEAIERPPNPISEIGIAVLDMEDTKGLPPGPCGQEWHPKITAHHLRTREYSGLVNHEFIQGCPDSFNFGKSTFPPKEKLAGATISVLDPYIDAGRDIVLVGHDTKQDVQYLASIGLDLINIPSICRMLDTQAIHQAWKGADNGRGLSGVLGDLGLVGTNLHNAGNDAVYTLQALIGVAIEEGRQREIEAKGEEYKPELWTR